MIHPACKKTWIIAHRDLGAITGEFSMAPPGSVPLDLVKALRARTSATMKQCKEALVATACDLDAATIWIQSGGGSDASPPNMEETLFPAPVTARSSAPTELPGIFASMAVVGDGGASHNGPLTSMATSLSASPTSAAAPLSAGLFGGMEITRNCSVPPPSASNLKEEVLRLH